MQTKTVQQTNRNISFLTIVMPIRNEAGFIHDTLRQLLSQDYPADRYEIIVADGMSDDGTREIVLGLASKHKQLRLMDNPKCLSSAGRNVGFKSGCGDYFLVVDGHCFIPDNKLFQNVIDCFEKSAADCLGRPQPLDPPGLTSFQCAVSLARASGLGHGSDSLIFGEFEGFASPVSNGAAYARHVFDKVGYVDENFDAAEDVDFNHRVELAGLKCYTSPRLKIHYYPRESLKSLFWQMKRYGTGRYHFIRKHRAALTMNQLIPPCFVAGLLIILIVGLLTLISINWLPFFLILLPVYILYTVLVLTESFRIASRHGRKYLLMLPIIFFVIHFGLGIGFIQGAFNHRRIVGT